jgi:DNA-binding response OmpR family regulator
VDAKRLKLLLCGEHVSVDRRLIESLKFKYKLSYATNINDLDTILEEKTFSLILLELMGATKAELKIIQKIKSNYKSVILIVINNKKNVQNVVNLFNAGAVDVFPVPYNVELLVERVEALLKEI